MQFRVRSETPEDVAAIHAVTVAAFRDAPHADHTEQFIVRELRNAGALALSLVAEVFEIDTERIDTEGQVVGHVAVSPVSIADGSETNDSWFGLGPISVHPDVQGRGVGSRLMWAALDDLRRRDAGGCVLLGDPAYYHRFGFRPDPNLVLPEVPPEYFQALTLRGETPNGIVTYHDAFGATA